MNQQLVNYIEQKIFPLYGRNDWAHQIWHIKEVAERSLKLAKDYPVNLDMVYTIAAFHDLGCFVNREKHEEVSAQLMLEDSFIRRSFSDEDRQTMSEAIVDHRGSLEHEPRSIYGKIIASADRFTTIEGILRSTHSYTLEFFPNVPWSEMVQRSYQYIEKKYGKGGYAKSPLPNPDFERFLVEVGTYLNSRELFIQKLKEVDDFLRKEYKLKPRVDD